MFGVDLPANAWLMIIAVVGVFVLITWWAIRDAFRREFPSTNEKMFWIQLATLVPFLGGIIYMIYGKKRGRKM